ncbi:MAG: alpha/beta hydrolase [Pseudomonadota bacterium]
MSLFLSLLFTVFTQSPALHADVDGQFFPGDAKSQYYVAPDGVKVHYVTMGDKGTPVVLIHGYYANARLNWFANGIATELAKTNRIIAIDNRGHGRSDKKYRKKYYGSNFWKDVIAIMDEQKITKAHFHGYSMGGGILTQVLFHAPERVITATFGGSGILEYDKELIAQIPADKKPTPLIESQEEAAQEFVKKQTNPDWLALYFVRRSGPFDAKENDRIDLTKVDIPVLAINGEYDAPNARSARMQRELADFQHVVIPGKGHLTVIAPGFMPPEYREASIQFILDYDQAQTSRP